MQRKIIIGKMDYDAPRVNTRDMHPALKFPEILDIIFKNCKVQDLKVCRLACKEWLDLSLKAWRLSVAIPLASDEKMAEYLSFMDHRRGMDISYVYDKYQLSFVTFRQMSVPSSFWNQCGSHVKVLHLVRCNFLTLHDMKTAIFSACPNLQELKLRAVRIEIDTDCGPDCIRCPTVHNLNLNLKRLNVDTRSTNRLAWAEVFERFPAVEEFDFNSIGDEREMSAAYDAIRTIRSEDPNMLQLSRVRLACQTWSREVGTFGNIISPSILPVLTDEKLCIERISIPFLYGPDTEVRLKQVLSTHRKSLRKLYLGRGGQPYLNTVSCFASLPPNVSDYTFPNLQEIVLKARVFTSLNFLQYTPNLGKLVLPQQESTSGLIAGTEFPGIENLRLMKCMELAVDDGPTTLSPKDLKKLIDWFPNIEKLKMDLDNETFALVCQSWANLTLLDIPRVRLYEDGLTGLDNDIIQLINYGDGNVEIPPTVPKANIGSLKHLRTFLAHKCSTSNTHFGLSAVHHGLSQMESLQTLRIDRKLMWIRTVETLVMCLSAKENVSSVKRTYDGDYNQVAIHWRYT